MSTPRTPLLLSSSPLLQVPNQARGSQSIHTPHDAGGGTTPTQGFHMKVKLGGGRVVDADVTYTTSRPSTIPGTPGANSLSAPSLLFDRQTLESEALATAISAALANIEEGRSVHTPPPSRNSSLHNSEDDEPIYPAPRTGYVDGMVAADIDDDVPPAADTDALLPATPSTASASIARSIGKAACTTVTTGIVYSLAAATAAPTALNATAAPSGKSPGEFGPAWWNDMSYMTRTHSIANGVSSFLINIIMNALFLPAAWKKFRDSIYHIFDSIEEFLDNSFSMILALGGALAAAAIAYNAFLWLPLGVFMAIIPATIAFVVTIAQRYVGVKSIFRRLRNLRDDDARAQLELADALQHINKQYLEEIEARFKETLTTLLAGRDGKKPLTEDEFEKLLVQLSSIVSEMQDRHPDLIKDKTTLEYITKYTGILFDMLFALLVIVPPAFLVHMQKGFDGVAKAKELITGNPLPSMNVLLQCLIGLDPAIVNAMFYGSAALEARTTVVETTKYLYQHPRSIAFAAPLAAGICLSSSGMQSVVTNVVNNENNLFHLKPNTTAANVLTASMTVGGGVVNGDPTFKKAFLSSPQPAKTVTVADMAKRAANTNEKVFCKEKNKDTTGALREHSLFTKKRDAEARARELYQYEPISGPMLV